MTDQFRSSTGTVCLQFLQLIGPVSTKPINNELEAAKAVSGSAKQHPFEKEKKNIYFCLSKKLSKNKELGQHSDHEGINQFSAAMDR